MDHFLLETLASLVSRENFSDNSLCMFLTGACYLSVGIPFSQLYSIFPRELFVISPRSIYPSLLFTYASHILPHLSSCLFSISILLSQINQTQNVPSRYHLSLKISSSVYFPYFKKWHCYFYAKWFLALCIFIYSVPSAEITLLVLLLMLHFCLPRNAYSFSSLRIASVMDNSQSEKVKVTIDSCLLTPLKRCLE